MVKRTQSKKRRPILKKAKSNNNGGESKTIAMLPSTTLKYREDTPEPTEAATSYSTSGFRSPILSPSSSQETLHPSKKSGKIFFAGDEDDEDEDEDMDMIDIRPGAFSSLQHSEGGSGLRRPVSSASLSAEPAGMRRTASGMFMPVEEGYSIAVDDGLIGRIINTVNTARDIARDIAHVIMNVGWRS
jgi:hypothetical protein